MKTLKMKEFPGKTLLVITFILSSCSEPEFCDCEALKKLKQETFESWQIIVSHYDSVPTLKQRMEWSQESFAANEAYVQAYEMVKKHCPE
jgi:hypothetical protein